MSDNQSRTDNYLLRLFEDGRRFTEDLLRENERLRNALQGLDSGGSAATIATGGASGSDRLQVLEAQNKDLRQQIDEMKQRFGQVEEENKEFADRYVAIERQNSNLINLYVASYRLHSTLQYQEVLTIIKEVVINMVGSERFGIYLVDSEDRKLILVGDEGLVEPDFQTLEVSGNTVGKAAETGLLYVIDPGNFHKKRNLTEPLAVIPLKVGETVLGAIAVFELLIQKDGFRSLDRELFDLLGSHAATAIYASKMFSESERKREALRGFLDVLKGKSKGS